MNYTAEKLEKSQVKFNYVVDKDAFNAAIKQAYEKTKHKYAVPGFRKGHAPQKVIEGMYGQGVFFSDAVNRTHRFFFVGTRKELRTTISWLSTAFATLT